MSEPGTSEQDWREPDWRDPDWTPNCHVCGKHFPGEFFPPDSIWVCRECVIGQEVDWQLLWPTMEALAEQRLQHQQRFRHVSERYPRRVAAAYSGDLKRAALASDEEVRARVARFERHYFGDVCDWVAIGEAERGRSTATAYPDQSRPAPDLDSSLDDDAMPPL